MNVIVMGCGRVGEQVCYLLLNEGHQVTVIDVNPQALARLGEGFKGRKVTGVGFDQDILIEAGIESADAFAATSSSDNANIVAARIARNYFRVPRVVARLYDPRRAEIYQRLGLLTISSTTWGAERIREILTRPYLDLWERRSLPADGRNALPPGRQDGQTPGGGGRDPGNFHYPPGTRFSAAGRRRVSARRPAAPGRFGLGYGAS